jgi:Arc/MetJ family transcription regulator
MRTTVTIDDKLLKRARELTGIEGTSALIKESLRTLVERESARRLAKLGGSDPRAQPIPRRQSESL